jgi:ribulose-5-phosphate 4-epimerase/fuculose-1-phosphate aldolase
MRPISRKLQSEFVAACHEAAERGLLRCSSGNVSWRVGDGRMLVTRTRSWLGRLTADDIAVCAIKDGASLNGVKPTVEVRFHAGILRARPDVNVVLHYQSPCATTLACQRRGRANYNVIPEIPFYIGPVGHVPYLPPGSPELASAVVEAMASHDLALMANHGQVTAAADFDHAVQNAEFFELACQIILAAGSGAKPLSAEAVRHLLAARAQQGEAGPKRGL